MREGGLYARLASLQFLGDLGARNIERARSLRALLSNAGSRSAGTCGNVKVGSKRFTESYILGELLARAAGGEHKPGLGNTAILYEALKNGAVDVYPEYTGTIAREILKTEESLDLAQLNRRLQPLGLAVSVPLGFSNSYALGTRLPLRTIPSSRNIRRRASACRTSFSGAATAGRA
jgi:glycine betaine/choline ABC-type transport system substrate-binding protein